MRHDVICAVYKYTFLHSFIQFGWHPALNETLVMMIKAVACGKSGGRVVLFAPWTLGQVDILGSKCAHCFMFSGKALHPHSASLHPGVLMGTYVQI